MRDRRKEFTNAPGPDSSGTGTSPGPPGDGRSPDLAANAPAPAAGAAPEAGALGAGSRRPSGPSGPGGGSGSPATPPPDRNAFSRRFLDRLREEDHPPTPEAANAGPWTVEPVGSRWDAPPEAPPEAPSETPPEARVIPHHVDALASRTFQPEAEWACCSAGEAGPRGVFARPDLAYLFAAALPLDGAPPRLRLARRGLDQALGGGPDWHRLTEDGQPVGRLAGFRPELVALANALAALRSRPLALAHFLAACGEETLEPAGRILDRLVRKGVG